MYFLAFDEIVKSKKVTPPINFDPESSDGELYRKFLTIYYSKFVRVSKSEEFGELQITNLGEVDKNGTPPEKRISSNFLTVPLKKAAQAKNPMGYPKRPAPLLSMGRVADGMNWGIDYHPGWKIIFTKFLEGRKTKTPFMDLAIFVLRDSDLKVGQGGVLEAVYSGLKELFSEPLADFWISHIKFEKKLANFPSLETQEKCSKILEKVGWQMTNKKKTEAELLLMKRIDYLEGILKKKGISF